MTSLTVAGLSHTGQAAEIVLPQVGKGALVSPQFLVYTPTYRRLPTGGQRSI